jgi:hypothetical protein
MLELPFEYSKDLDSDTELIMLGNLIADITFYVGMNELHESQYSKEDISQFLDIVEHHSSFNDRSKSLTKALPALYEYAERTIRNKLKLNISQNVISASVNGILNTLNGLIKRAEKGDITEEERDYSVAQLLETASTLRLIDIQDAIAKKERRVFKYSIPLSDKI